MTCLCDLHLHSTASDGQYRPAALVRMARQKGLQVIALTDHDSIKGVEEAAAEGERLGVRVLPGVEMSAREYRSFHLLGYCFAPHLLQQAGFFQGLEDGRKKRSEKIMDYLRSKNVDFPLEEVQELAADGVIGRPHFARVMLKRGICKTWEEVFRQYLDTDEFHKIVENKPSAKECADAIHKAGGVVSLAHPYQLGLPEAELEALVRQMKAAGQLDGIECWHSGHTQEQSSFYLSLAQKYRLLITGGSDFHGEQVKADRPMARLTLEMDWLPAADLSKFTSNQENGL